MKTKIRAWNGTEFADLEVDAMPSGTPGLVIHRAADGVGMVLTHAATGTKLAVFADDVFWCAQGLGELGDWTAKPGKEMLAAAWGVLGSYNALPGGCIAPREASEAEWARSEVPAGNGSSS